MKKQRVLALLLALSLAVGSNGMTVLAAGTELSGSPAMVMGEKSEETADDGAVQTDADGQNNSDGLGGVDQSGQENQGGSAGADQSGQENQGGSAGADQSGQENQGGSEGADQNGQERPDGSEGEDRSDQENQGGSEGEGQNGQENPDDSEETETPAGDDQNGDDDGTEVTDPSDEITDESGELSEEEQEPVEDAEEEELSDAPQSAAPRMMSFKDEVGMLVTYNVADKYKYEIDKDGTLFGISKEGGDIEGDVVLEEGKGIKKIASGVFTGNTGITYIKMPAGMEAIGADAFKGCTALKGMTIPTGVTAIEESAFEGCSALTQFALPATMERIGNRAFYGDTRLFMVYMKSIDISALTSIGDSAFYNCGALAEFCSDTSFTFPESLTSIGEYAFYGCNTVKSIVFSENITTMGSRVFMSCTSLAEITLPRALTAIPQYAFAGCRSLVSVEFGGGKDNETRTIGAYAFDGCYHLGSMELLRINKIERNAYKDCTRLIRVQIPNMDCVIEDDAFPDMETLYLIGVSPSTAETYTKNRKIKFINMATESDTNYYQCTTQPLGTGTGTLTLSTAKPGSDVKNPNDANGKKGVPAGTDIYVIIQPDNGSQLVSGSLKCNGTKIDQKDLVYSFKMPKGGALVTAEFEIKGGSSTIDVTQVDYEFSNGSDGRNKGAELKIGQTTRLFLLDRSGNVIPTSKVTFTSEKPTVAAIAKSGIITAKQEGVTDIEMKVTGGTGELVRKTTVHVYRTDIESLKLTLDSSADAYDRDIVTVSEQLSGEQMVKVASMDIISVSEQAQKMKLKALAYDADMDGMKTALKWTSSDSKVAQLAASSTPAGDSVNTVTIPKGASGEATITVSATNADKKTITQKFIIQVRDTTPRLSTTTLTINPNKEDGAVLRVISAYGKAMDPATFKFVDAQNDKIEENKFQGVYDAASSTDTVKYFTVRATYSGLDEKDYTVKVSMDGKTNPTPVKITVKSSLPNPKVAFDKKQPKINLFYANDGTEVKPVVTNLGNEKVERYTLEPLSTDPEKDDRLFTENFEVDEETGIITQKNDNMILTEKKKLVTTGYLVLHFEGYKNTAVRKYKITIPTQTVKPSYKLDRTSDVYYARQADRKIVLTLLDTKTKGKDPVRLDEGDWTIRQTPETNVDAIKEDVVINDQGQIEMSTYDNMTLASGKVVLTVRNNEWASGQEFKYTYTVKATAAAPKIKLKAATVSLNSNYTEQEEKFYLTSNQCDTNLDDSQEFVFQPTAKNGDQREYLHVTYNGGVGNVSVDPDVKAGSYKFKCDSVLGVNGEHYNSVTLTVKVVDTRPTMTVKGSPALNLFAESGGTESFAETAELKLNAKLPEGYEIDSTGSTSSIECTNVSEGAQNFNWNIMDNTLLISLNTWVSPQKYSFTMTPEYVKAGSYVTGKAVKFSVKVYSGEISVKMSQKGTLNLVDRRREYTLKNSIVFTPTFKNLKDTVEEARIFDANAGDARPTPDDDESVYFQAEALDGKVYVAPRDGAELENGKSYQIRLWVKPRDYDVGMWVSSILKIKTAQTLPKVTADRTDLNLYLSNKAYETTFTVSPKEGSIGNISGVVFGEKDTKSQDSFEITCGEPREDGSMEVRMRLKNTVSFAGNSANKVTVYVMFDGQGVNTVGPAITMNVRINK